MNIKTIPFDLPFLPTFTEYIVEKHKKDSPDFGSILVVFPSERNKVYFREYLLKKTEKQGIIPPCILTVEQLYNYILEKIISDPSQDEQFLKEAVLSDDIERNIFLKQAVEKVKFRNLEHLPFVRFISVGRKLLAFFDELASWNLSIKDIENAKEKLHFPPQYIDEELSVFRKIHKKYEELLTAKGLFDAPSVYLSIAKNFKTEYLKDFKNIYIAGNLALTFMDVLLIKKILAESPSGLIIHAEKDGLSDNSLDNIFYHHNKTLNMLEADIQNIQTISEQIPNEKTPVHIQKCKSALDEVYFIIDALSKLASKYSLHRIGVVLPEESLYLPLKDALEKFNIPYNLSMGIPFRHTGLYSFLKDAHDFLDSDSSSKKFLALAKNPVIKEIFKDGLSFKELAYKLDLKIREGNLPKIYGKFAHAESQALIDYIFGIMNKLNRDCSFAEYVKGMRETISELIELNSELRKRLSKVLNDLMEKLFKMESSKIPETFCPKGKDKLKFIISILETISFPVSGDFLSGIQVIGVLEARNIDFDCVIIPSCNEGIFPQKSEKDLFLPADLRKEMGLPFYKERDALYCYYFHQLITGKKEVYLSYRIDEKTPLGLRNRWIEKLAEGENERFTVNENEQTHFTDFSRLFAANFKKHKKHKKTRFTRKSDKILNILNSSTFSPSALKTFKLCPYKFYLSHILKMKESKTIKEEYDAAMWGKIFHNTFARLYNEKYPEGYTQDIKEQVVKNLFELGEEEFKKVYPEPKDSLYWDWEANKQRMLKFVDLEIAHFKEGFVPVRLEKELLPYTIQINGKQKIKIGGRPDRIDSRSGKYYVIDYKIGKKPASKTYRISAFKDFTEFQLPLYGLAFAQGDAEKIGGLLYYHLDENLKNFVKLDIFKKEEGENYIKLFKETVLLPILREIFDKNLPFNQTEDFDTCQRCVFVDLCGRRV